MDKDGNIQGSITAWAASQMLLDVETGGEDVPVLAFVRVGIGRNDNALKTNLGGFYVDPKYKAQPVAPVKIEPSGPVEEGSELDLEEPGKEKQDASLPNTVQDANDWGF